MPLAKKKEKKCWLKFDGGNSSDECQIGSCGNSFPHLRGDVILLGPTWALALEDHLPNIYWLVPKWFGCSIAKFLHLGPTWICANHGDILTDRSMHDHMIILN